MGHLSTFGALRSRLPFVNPYLKQMLQGHGWADALPVQAIRPFAGLSPAFRENPCFCSGKGCVILYLYIGYSYRWHIICPGWHMSFADLSPAFRGLQFPFRKMFVLTCYLNSFTGNNGRPSHVSVTNHSWPTSPLSQ